MVSNDRESRRQWLSGLAMILTALVALFGFWRLAPSVTFTIALIALIVLVGLFWFSGKASEN